jgi:hypothetical protein
VSGSPPSLSPGVLASDSLGGVAIADGELERELGGLTATLSVALAAVESDVVLAVRRTDAARRGRTPPAPDGVEFRFRPAAI